MHKTEAIVNNIKARSRSLYSRQLLSFVKIMRTLDSRKPLMKKYKQRFISAGFLLLTLLCSSLLYGQESTDETGLEEDAEAVSPEGEGALPAALGYTQETEIPAADGNTSLEETPESEPTDDGGTADNEETPGFLKRSYEYDINTSRREELMAWCQVLQLSSDGTVEQLKTRLFNYYRLKETTADSTEETGDQVVIESAKRTEYLAIDIGGDKKEFIVRLSGDVLLTVQESARNRKHQVYADTVLFNDDNNTISAVGSIKYIVNTNGREERFTGDSLTFEVSNWTGIIFHGTSERKEKINEKEVPFFFRGKSIERASAHILVLDDGSITSYDIENPDYALKAKKIWITGPGEWSLFSATIYVGHIPVLYLPFYWKSGRDLFFNPVIGQKNDVGYYIQTTMYLLGRKNEDDDFTMLGFGDSAGSEYDMVREGIYLVKKPRDTVNSDESGSGDNENNSTLKYTLDAYSNLGAVTGIHGTLPKLGKNGSLNFFASMAVSRSVDSTGNTYFNDGGSSKTYWNSSSIGETKLPFRWGSWADFKYNNWKFHFDWYSDPYYNQDFSDRKENFDWMKLLLGEEDETKKPNTVSTMKWDLSGSYQFKLQKTSPWLSRLSLSQIRASLLWKNKNNKEVTGSASPDRSYNPGRKFFYPDKLVLPDIKLSISGSLPPFTVKRKKKELQNIDSADSDIRSDAPADNSDSVGKPELFGSFDAIYNSKTFETSLNYGINSKFYMDDQLDNTAWNGPADISFDKFKGTKINTIHTGNINYGMIFWDGLISFKSSAKFSGYYQIHTAVYGRESVIEDKTKLEDFKYSKALWDQDAVITLKPLIGVPLLKDSSIGYAVDTTIFDYKFRESSTVDNPEYEMQWINNEEDIKKHESTVSIILKRGVFSFNSSFLTNIPPLDIRYEIQEGVGLSYQGFTAKINQKNSFKDNAWKHGNLNMSASWKGWKDEVTVSQTAQFDLENNRFANLESLVKFWGFQARFIAAYGVDYTWNKNTYTWNTSPEAFNPSSIEFSYSRNITPAPFWKNRIQTKTVLNTSWKVNLLKPTDNILRLTWTQEFKLHKFLDLKISLTSANKSMYIYFPEWREELGITGKYSFFEDLFKSFNLFSEQDRMDSQFNMEKVDISMVHHLRNWDVTVEYSGLPSLNTAKKTYDWKTVFSIYVKWNPLPLFNQKTTYKDEVWSVESFGDNIDLK